jgi:tetratricopeptide (TPR) repeat protein
MRRIWQIVFLLVPLLAGANLISIIATPQEEQFNAGNKLFVQNKFADAAAAYEKLIQTGSFSPALYFNLGNAYFKSGQIGRAITAYRRAEELAPRDPDMRANLRFARNQVQGPTIRPGLIERSLATLSLNEWAWLSAGAFWLTLGLFAAKQLKPQLAGALKTWTALSVAATVLLGATLTIAAQTKLGTQTVVVTAHEATVRTSPFDEAASAFTANDGAELQVIDRKDAWLQVTDGGRRVGWVKRDSVASAALN